METATDGLWAFLSQTVTRASAHHKAHLSVVRLFRVITSASECGSLMTIDRLIPAFLSATPRDYNKRLSGGRGHWRPSHSIHWGAANFCN